jgi:hypothetical protein
MASAHGALGLLHMYEAAFDCDREARSQCLVFELVLVLVCLMVTNV